MVNDRKIECKIIRTSRPLTDWERRNVSSHIKDIFTGYDLDVLIVTNNRK